MLELLFICVFVIVCDYMIYWDIKKRYVPSFIKPHIYVSTKYTVVKNGKKIEVYTLYARYLFKKHKIHSCYESSEIIRQIELLKTNGNSRFVNFFKNSRFVNFFKSLNFKKV